ncbi:MAG: DEAD/DEAH box helicase [Nanohaloarchaea archaeon]|nr:DEAD/DEAH box helicase [Candidatus Nanohaloarchaea archaeon]
MKVENLELPENIKTDYIESGITELNPPQKKAVDAGLMDAEDMIVAAPTASGKTFIAELAMVNQVVKGGGKAVYIVPLKALASEKYEDFSERYEDLNVSISVGDLDDEGDYLENTDIVVTTSEKLDSMLRHNPSWIHEINLVVTDEIHLLTSENRGPTLEVTLTRLRDLLDFQMLGLSATISNSNELAEWLDAELVESDYRPVELKEGIMEGNTVDFYPDDYEKQDSDEKANEDRDSGASAFKTGTELQEEEENEVESETFFVDDHHGRKTLNLVENTLEKDKQTIIFCSSRKGAEKSSDRCGNVVRDGLSREEKKELERYADDILNVLGSPTSQCKRLAKNVRKGAAYHHAGLVTRQRQLVEKAFKEGLIRTVSATPTLAAGVNLPAFRVIMRDLKRYTGRGMEFIPVLEYEQMCLPYDQKIVLPNGRRKKIGKIVENKEEIEVVSHSDSGLEAKKVADYFERQAQITEIETETGSFRLTENHPVLAKKENDFEWLEAGKLSEGDKIKLGNGHPSDRKPFFYELVPNECYVEDAGKVLIEYKEEFDLKDKELAERLDLSESTVYHYKNNRKAVPLHGMLKACKELGKSKGEIAAHIDNIKSSYGNRIEIPEKLTEDFLWLLGIVLTDGNLNRTEDKRTGSVYTNIRVFNTNKEIIERAKSAFNNLGLECYEEEREPGKYRLEVGNTLLAELMKDVFEIPYGNKSEKTEVSEIIFELPERLQASFIEGVFDGDGSYYENKEEYKRRIHFSSSSEKFGKDLQELLAGLGVKSRVDSKFIEDLEIDGQKYEVNKKSYFLKIRNKDSINKLAEKIDPVKVDIETEEYSNYQNSNEHRKKAAEYTEILDIRKGNKEKVYNIEVEDNHNYVTGSRAILHNCGRAGRPKYDDYGEAISIAKNPGTKDKILERFVLGEPERIQSKLAAEPILRMHTMSLIASNYCNSMEDVYEFYSKTFYAYQFGDFSEVKSKVKSVVEDLIEYEFLDEEIDATPIGKRVSELYIDPDSANLMLESLKRTEEKETKPVSYLFMLSRTTEMQPRPRIKDDERSDIQQAFNDAEKYILEDTPLEWDPEYDHFLECMKNSMVMQGWISEVDEEQLMDKYGVAPGGIRAKMKDADWLLYAAKEMARMKDLGNEKELEKLRIRLQHGIEKELLNLVEYDQIGRVRARKLHDHGIRDREAIREVSFEKLKRLIGDRTAKKLKKQVGEENIFDRENIMDYF